MDPVAVPKFDPRGDRVLANLPAEHPFEYDRLPFTEQQWRGRAFLIFYTISGGRLAYAWWQALRPDEGGETEAFIRERVTDDEIISGLLGMNAAKGTEAQQAQGGPA